MHGMSNTDLPNTELPDTSLPDAAIEAGDSPDYVSRVKRVPMYFGPEKSPLFGWLHMPVEQPVSQLGMVLCPPLGSDYLNTYPVLRHLANRLAYHGIPVLRFDYSGVGNSSGFDVDADRVSSWMGDIGEARDALSRASGCAETGLFGVRVGGLLAAKYAHDNTLPCLVLWGAVAQGRSYMREMRAIHLTAEGDNVATISDAGNIEAGGFSYTPQTAKDISAISLGALVPKSRHILFAPRDDLTRDQDIPEGWSGAERCMLPGFAGMLTSSHDPYYRLPDNALDQLTSWMVKTAATATSQNMQVAVNLPASMPLTVDMRAEPGLDRSGIRESAFMFGGKPARFSIITEPMAGSPEHLPWVIFSGTGGDHSAGTNRLTVLLSRELAHAGMTCVRFDFPGIGDSAVNNPALENQSYQANTSSVIATLIDEIQQSRGKRKFILTGLCSGAFASFHAGLDLERQPIVECVLLNPLIFYWEQSKLVGGNQPPDEARQQSIKQHNRWKYYLGQMRNLQSWKNLFTAKTDMQPLLQAILHRGKSAASEYLQSWTGRSLSHDADPLTQDIRSLVESGRKLTFVFARADHGYGLLMSHAGPIVRYYMRKRRVKMWFIDRTNHVFSGKKAQMELIGSLISHFIQSYVSK